ncbi:hypothetical protein ACHAXT_001794 [Thalassiosira profunda]
MKDDGENWELFLSDPTKLRLDGGTFAPVLDCWERGEKNWHAIRSDGAIDAEEGDDADGATLIIAHGQMGQCMLLSALGLGVETYGHDPEFIFGNCGCAEIEWADGEGSCRRWRWMHPEESSWELADARRREEGEHTVARLGEDVSHM